MTTSSSLRATCGSRSGSSRRAGGRVGTQAGPLHGAALTELNLNRCQDGTRPERVLSIQTHMVHCAWMRVVAVALLTSVVVVMPALAGTIDPADLVAQQTDVPSGYRLVRAESGRRTNASEMKTDPEVAEVARRAGRIDAYLAVYDKGTLRVLSRADLFRAPRGAGTLSLADSDLRRAGVRACGGGDRPRRGGLVVLGRLRRQCPAVAGWRHGVFAALTTWGMSRGRQPMGRPCGVC